MRHVNKILLATLNPDKFHEFKQIMASNPQIELVLAEGVLRNPQLLALVETHSTYLENAMAKARLANQGCHFPCLSDDSGLEIDGLSGRPGPRSARYAVEPGKSLGKSAQAKANMDKVLNELKANPSSSKKARFVTTLALVVEGISVHATGILEGEITLTPRGENGFGYDPIFVPKGSQKTLAEMSDNEKNAISHRARAVQELLAQIQARGIELARP